MALGDAQGSSPAKRPPKTCKGTTARNQHRWFTRECSRVCLRCGAEQFKGDSGAWMD